MSEKPSRGIKALRRIIRQGRQRIAELEADLENCVLAKRQAENAVARVTAEGSNLRKRITQLEAERDALKAELVAERMKSNAWKEAYRIECESKRYTAPVTLRNAGPGKPLHDEDPTL